MKTNILGRFLCAFMTVTMVLVLLPAQVFAVSQEDKLDAYVKQVVDSIPKEFDTDTERALYLHDFLVVHVTYEATDNDQTAYGALIEGKAVCAGYARAYELLLKAVGIDSCFITGTANNGTSTKTHAWNMVFLNGKCYFTDVTWDDPVGNDGSSINHTYFNVTLEQISKDHFPDAESKKLLPKTCDHDDLDYYTLTAGVGTGVGIFTKDTTTDEAKAHFVLEGMEGSDAVVICEFKFVGDDPISWIYNNWASIGRGLGMTGALSCSISQTGFVFRMKIIGYIDEATLATIPVAKKTEIFEPDPDKLQYLKPEIAEQPKDVTAKAGDTVVFCAKATGNGLTYQWQWRKNDSAGWASTTVTGCKTDTISLTATAARNGYQYRCKITDSNGNVVYSDAAVLTVATSLEIKNQPDSVSASVGDTVKFKVKASGDGLTYQWQWRKNASAGWASTTVTGCKTDTISLTATAARNGYQYRCKITDSNGNVVYSDAAVLTVAASIEIKNQPDSVSASVGDTVKFKVKASGNGLTYQWQWRKNDSASWASTTVTGCKTDTISLTATAARNGYQYRCKITDSNGNVVYSDAAVLTVAASIEIKNQPDSVSASVGDTVKFKVKASGNGLTYQWQWRKNAGAGWASTTVTGCKTDTISLTATAARNGYQYRCKITDSNGNVVYSDAAVLNVGASLKIKDHPDSVRASVGDTVKFKVKASGDGLTYQWQWRKNDSASWASTTVTGCKTDTISLTATAARNGYQYRCKITDSNGNVVYSDAAILTVG